jgi:uncharacterized protein YbaP (TraB family)
MRVYPKILLVISFFSLLFIQGSYAKTFLWEITKNHQTVYLGGTIHLLGQDDYPLPMEYYKAFNKAKIVVFETDINAVKDPEFSQKLMSKLMYPQGESLKDNISPQVFARLSEYFQDKLPMAQVDRFKPSLVVLTISSLEFQQQGLNQQGVDEFFFKRALREQREILTLETVDQQLQFVVDMGRGYENQLIENTLSEVNQSDQIVETMKSAWRQGDVETMENIILQDMIINYPELHHSILVQRNLIWLPEIEKLFQTTERELVLVGALHLMGQQGLLNLLKQKGYTIRFFH